MLVEVCENAVSLVYESKSSQQLCRENVLHVRGGDERVALFKPHSNVLFGLRPKVVASDDLA